MKQIYTLLTATLITSAASAQCTITSSSVTPNGMTVNATANGTGATIPVYAWEWGDASSPTQGQSAAHTYAAPGTYTVCVIYLDAANSSCIDSACNVVTVTSVGVHEAGAAASSIDAVPNPFGATTTFNVNIANSSDVEISVYDMMGRKVETVIDEEMSAGRHSIVWTPANLADGVYFVQMVIDGKVTTKRIVHSANQ